MNKDVVLGLVRHVLTAVGGSFMAGWGLTGSEQDLAIGAVVTLAGVVWSVIDKRRA